MRVELQTVQPNRFELKGHDTEISYTIQRGDQLHYKGRLESQPLERGFPADEIQLQESPAGTLLSVTLEAVPDFQTTALTLLLPAIVLADPDARLSFQTVAVLTRTRDSIAPQTLTGVLQSYEILRLKGTASFGVF